MNRTALIAAITAHVLTWIALIFLAFWPATYQGVSATAVAVPPGQIQPEVTVEQQEFSSSLIAVNGFRVLFVLFIPTVLTGIALAAVVMRAKRPRTSTISLWVSTVLTLVFSVLGMFSIGMLYLPSVIALLVAAIATSLQRRSRAQLATE